MEQLDPAVKTAVKQQLLQTLASPHAKTALDAGQVISSVSAIELPVGQWPELVQTLLGFVSQTANVGLRVATLQTIGFICETVVSSSLDTFGSPV